MKTTVGNCWGEILAMHQSCDDNDPESLYWSGGKESPRGKIKNPMDHGMNWVKSCLLYSWGLFVLDLKKFLIFCQYIFLLWMQHWMPQKQLSAIPYSQNRDQDMRILVAVSQESGEMPKVYFRFHVLIWHYKGKCFFFAFSNSVFPMNTLNGIFLK